jgi:hypothetical protein
MERRRWWWRRRRRRRRRRHHAYGMEEGEGERNFEGNACMVGWRERAAKNGQNQKYLYKTYKKCRD